MDLDNTAKILAEELNKGIITAGKDIGFKLTLGLVIIAVAIYSKNKEHHENR